MVDATHDERTALAWGRTWLAAAAGVAILLRIVPFAGSVTLAAALGALLIGGLALVRRPWLRAPALVAVVCGTGAGTALHALWGL